uniref:LOW QUALITY PROTEIN: alpha-1,6-mannosyl-glycoprotein 2-beta-N-acetylglucosaminyltransferase-like n=1 Tax=Styela clava TaxID=7725 RepID=UPI00193AC5B2|nr:LOW QUALITY PROTEIN: alpha-1,6-mannosyl-glycoprotein 2-beta-N-acetylglucosaminyltransferase-like [Styela clava]
MSVSLGVVWRAKFVSHTSPAKEEDKSISADLPSKIADKVRSDAPVLAQPVKEQSKNVSSRGYSLEEMREEAKKLNFIQLIKNKEKFGDHRADDPVIVVQAHDRANLLKILFDSLREVKGIESATLVISRDKFTPDMDNVIDKNLNFCRYVEIFFPFLMHLFPNKFPGEDPNDNDCPRDLSKSAAMKQGCNNAECPDMYGHYREIKYVQLKHHWFWKLNMVFSGIRELNGNTGPILLLEDDNYVIPDVIDVMKKAVLLRDSECKDCLAITLGAYDFTTDYRFNGADADVKPWVSSKHNIGMVINQQFFDKITSCSKYFCTYDDYNWDWTLQSTALKCFSDIHLYSLILKVPRVYHLGCTGFHQKPAGGTCDIAAEVEKLRGLLRKEASNLFPPTLFLKSSSKSPNSPHVQNGGWGDIRDHELCQSYTSLCKEYLNLG